MDDRILMLGLRLIHIIGGILWVGGAVMVAWFLQPAQRAMGAEGGRFMRRLFGPGRLPVFFGISMLLTLVSGFWMFGRWASVGGSDWIESSYGTALSVGGGLALLGALVGFGSGITNGARLAKVGKQMAASPGAPDPALVAEADRLDSRMAVANHVVAVLLIAAAAAMAMAQYF